MKIFQRLIVCFGMLFFYPIMAQSILKGKVVDQYAQVVEGVTVMVDGSSLSTTTDQQGNFQIQFPNGQHALVFRHEGFELKRITVNAQYLTPIVVTMVEKIIELEQANIRAMSREDWEYYYQIFKSNFLGIDQPAKQCKILNPNILRFNYEPENRVLTASAREPLIVENLYLGYRIEYDLSEFMMDYKSQYLLVIGSSYFQELKASKSKQNKWQKNRKKAYLGSFTHFLKSVYDDKINENGFDVKRLIREENPAYTEAVERIKKGESNIIVPRSKTIAYLVNQPVPIDSLVQRKASQVMMNFEGLYSVEYTLEKEDIDYVKNIKHQNLFGNQVSLFSLKSPIELTPEGYYVNPGDVILEEYWTWEKFAHLLPIDYVPN